MDKNRALTEIEKIVWSKEYINQSLDEKRKMIYNILNKLQSYNYELGKRHGMFKAINVLTGVVEKDEK